MHINNELETIDFTHVVPGRRLVVRFQPQQWINDNAVDSDPAVMIDVTDAYLALDVAARAALRDNRDESDQLVHDASTVWKDHDGPGYVDVEEFLAAFHAPESEEPTHHSDEHYRSEAKARLKNAGFEMFDAGEPSAVAVMLNEERGSGFLGAWVDVSIGIPA